MLIVNWMAKNTSELVFILMLIVGLAIFIIYMIRKVIREKKSKRPTVKVEQHDNNISISITYKSTRYNYPQYST